MKPIISVIICTHNPKKIYIERVLTALRSQSLPLEQWELLLIDNASKQPLAQEIDLSWHPDARHIREDELGLTPARLRGIKEAQAELLVFVDDDNILDSDYLEAALEISRTWVMLGAWGGQVRPEFEQTPPEWTKPYWGALAIKEFEQDQWSNLPDTIPCGAGICIRKSVGNKYSELLRENPERLQLDRKGKLLLSGGDLDLALTSHELGLGTGLFVKLKLTHILPAYRLQENYLDKWIEGNSYSCVMLDFWHGKMPTTMHISWARKIIEFYRMFRMQPRERRFYKAWRRGQSLATKEILDAKKQFMSWSYE